VTATQRPQVPADRGGSAPRVCDENVQRLERAMGPLSTAAMASMDRRLPWFRAMSAENRSWLGLVAQAALATFLDWVKHPERGRPAVAGQVFGTAPRELARAVSLQQTVEMARVIIDVVEAQVDDLAAPGGEAELREAVLRYTREIAFGAAQVYARTAEARGAWDARLEALVVDSLVRGEVDEDLQSWASALNWSSGPVVVIAGNADDTEPEGLIDELRGIARRARLDLLAGVHGHRLVVVVGGAADPLRAARLLAGRFGAGPVIVGPVVGDLQSATQSASAALAGLRAAAAWPDAPRPVEAIDLLPERALDGDEPARAQLLEEVYEPLLRGGSALLDTVMTYLEQGHSLEATARLLFVHPNTVRYRLRRVSELTGLVPGDGRGGFALWVAVVLGRLANGYAAAGPNQGT
jgi:PucR C-terminal helix-turn-helix domain/GGDEF-like domain